MLSHIYRVLRKRRGIGSNFFFSAQLTPHTGLTDLLETKNGERAVVTAIGHHSI